MNNKLFYLAVGICLTILSCNSSDEQISFTPTLQEQVEALLNGGITQEEFLDNLGYEEYFLAPPVCEAQDMAATEQFHETAWMNTNYEGLLPSDPFVREEYHPTMGFWNLFGSFYKTAALNCNEPITALYAFDKVDGERCNFHLAVLGRDGQITRYPVDASAGFTQVTPNESFDFPDDTIGFHVAGLTGVAQLEGMLPEDDDLYDGDMEMEAILTVSGVVDVCVPEELQEYPLAFGPDEKFRRFLVLFSDAGPQIVRWARKDDPDYQADRTFLVASPEDAMILDSPQVVEFSRHWHASELGFRRVFFFDEDAGSSYFYPAVKSGNILAIIPLKYLDAADMTICP